MRWAGGWALTIAALPPPQNFTSTAVMECLGSCLTNKYSEGAPAPQTPGAVGNAAHITGIAGASCSHCVSLGQACPARDTTAATS